MDNYRVTFEKFIELSYKLLEKIESKKDQYKAILCPLRGGFFLSYFMNEHLKLPVLYIEISSYTGKEQKEFKIKIKPDLTDGKYLLCDDIYDSGNTVKKIYSLYPNAEFDTICLVSKIKDAEVIYAALVENQWVDFFWEVM
ncbi:MAG: phosphoribosyltransferase [Spirochaetes bacterium]|nr:phosphoribosyltransferase [Spirochaetota bacterium]